MNNETCGFQPENAGYAPCTRAKGHRGPCLHPFSEARMKEHYKHFGEFFGLPAASASPEPVPPPPQPITVPTKGACTDGFAGYVLTPAAADTEAPDDILAEPMTDAEWEAWKKENAANIEVQRVILGLLEDRDDLRAAITSLRTRAETAERTVDVIGGRLTERTVETCELDAALSTANARNAELEADAKRWEYAKAHYIAADFEYGEPPCCALIIEIPRTTKINADFAMSIDNAIAASISEPR